MTIIDRPAPPRHRATAPATTSAPTATPAAVLSDSAPLGGRYVTTSSPRAATEGTYITRWTPTADVRDPGPALTRGTYVSVTTPAPTSGGHYTFAG